MTSICSDGKEVRALEYTTEVSDRGYTVVKKAFGGIVLTPEEVSALREEALTRVAHVFVSIH